MTIKEDFIATCQALRKNDPCLTKLNLVEYGSMLDCRHARRVAPARKCVQQVALALEDNTFVEELTLSEDLCVDSILQLSHFMRSSPSLKHLDMQGKARGQSEAIKTSEVTKTNIIFDAISRSSVLVKLSLSDVIFGDHCPLEGFLSSTRTLVEFSYFQSSALSYPAARAIGTGLARNKSLVKISWETSQAFKFLEEILFGLGDHFSLKTLDLKIKMTESSSLALRSLLHFNGTLETLSLTQFEDQEKIPTMVAVLAGLAKNTGLKEFAFDTDSSETSAILATAWTNMLQRNTSITILDLRNADSCEDNTEDGICSAVFEGLVENSTLETLRLPDVEDDPIVLDGVIWQEILESNHSLRKLCFTECSVSLEAFQCLARGLSHNTSLESLDLSCTGMTEPSLIALVDGLRTNKTMKFLDLSNNSALSQAGRAAIERLIGYNVLRELDLANTQDSVGASILTSGLSDNHSLVKLDLDHAFVDGEGSETFRALCESLRGNMTLRYLNVRHNGVRLNGVCVTTLKLDTMSLQILDLDFNSATSCGITALAHSLQGPCTLKELSLIGCNLDDTGLLKLGEALTTNVSLEDLDVRGNHYTHDGACQFFELLPHMKGLKAVYGLVVIKRNVPPTEAVGMALFDGLRKNTKLQKIFADNEKATVDSYFPPGVAREINFYLLLNSNGRMLLRPPGGAEPPSGLWPRVLAKITGPRDMSLLFYFLQNKPKIVNWNAPANRKRKASDSPSLK
jgi:Leucine-rich repeat (LRR) protein